MIRVQCPSGHEWLAPYMGDGFFDLCSKCPHCGKQSTRVVFEVKNVNPRAQAVIHGVIIGDLEEFPSERETSPDLSIIHLAKPEGGILLPVEGIPPIECGDKRAAQWCADETRVTCSKCLESIAKKDRRKAR